MRPVSLLTTLLLAMLAFPPAPLDATGPVDATGLVDATGPIDQAIDNAVAKKADATIVYLVRHAEKAAAEASEDPKDPHLTEAGDARAVELARVLGEAGIDTLFSTPFHRTRETAAPLAAQNGIAVTITPISKEYATALAKLIRAEYAGKTILVVGHSNTTPDVIRALGVTSADSLALEEDEYDDLFLVTLPPQGGAFMARVRFGAQTP